MQARTHVNSIIECHCVPCCIVCLYGAYNNPLFLFGYVMKHSSSCFIYYVLVAKLGLVTVSSFFLILNWIFHSFAFLTRAISWSSLEINFIFTHNSVIFSIYFKQLFLYTIYFQELEDENNRLNVQLRTLRSEYFREPQVSVLWTRHYVYGSRTRSLCYVLWLF